MIDYTVSISGIDTREILDEWRWLIPQQMRLISITIFGDAFLCDFDGSISWLDAAGGKLLKVADSMKAFEKEILDDANVDKWFLPSTFADLKAHGINLLDGQCYGYKKPPCLGGGFDYSNFEPTDISVHFSILGQIHEQIKDLPAGTPIGKLSIKTK